MLASSKLSFTPPGQSFSHRRRSRRTSSVYALTSSPNRLPKKSEFSHTNDVNAVPTIMSFAISHIVL